MTRHWLSALFVCVFAGLLLGCGEQDFSLIVALECATEECQRFLSQVRAFDVGVRIDGQDRGGGSIPGDQRRFRLLLPLGGKQLDVTIDGRDQEGCNNLHGEGATDGKGIAANLSVTLTARPDACKLVVRTTGGGSGTILAELANGRTFDCQPCLSAEDQCREQCTTRLPQGTSVSLRAIPDSTSYFSNWAGACEGRDVCTVRVGSKPIVVWANITPPPVCVGGGWCWDNPPSWGGVLRAAWLASADEGWAVGDGGMILHWQNGVWRQVTSPTTATLNAVWGNSSDCVWVAGDGGVAARWDGKRFIPVRTDTTWPIYGIWGSAPDHVWLVGLFATIRQCHIKKEPSDRECLGISIAEAGTADLRAITGLPDGRAWITGQGRILLSLKDGSWQVTRAADPSPLHQNELLAIWATETDLWAAGRFIQPNGYFHGTVFRWPLASARDWQAERVPGQDNKEQSRFNALTVGASGQPWLVGSRGQAFRRRPDPESVWDPVGTGTDSDLWAIAAFAKRSFWVVGEAGTHFRGDGLTFDSQSTANTDHLYAIWGTGLNDVWVGAQGKILRWDGLSWRPMLASPQTDASITGIWGTAADDVWTIARDGTVHHWNGTRWAQLPSTTSQELWGIWGSKPGTAFIVGAEATLLRCNRVECVRTKIPDPDQDPKPQKDWPVDPQPRAIWGIGTDLWVAGSTGYKAFVTRWSGGSEQWQSTILPDTSPFSALAIWGSGPEDIWVGGDQLHHYGHHGGIGSPLAWQRHTDVKHPMILWSIHGSRDGDLWMVGGETVLRGYADVFSAPPLGIGPANNLTAVWGAGRSDIWAVGLNGTILRYRP